ncbi:MAG: DUF421 domain-containing protein [Bacilli bacterium]|nr:DUF421 domain-containing protein [Bacilli bacterium]
MEKELLQLGDVALRALVSLVTLFLITKLLGKKQVSQLSLFDYVIGISIGNFAAEMTINLESEYLHGTLAVIIFGLVAYFVSVITMKSIHLRRFFMGRPTILIQDGKLLMKGLQKVKFDINDLLEECRSNGYFDISEIAYGVLETSGKLSILPKAEYKTPVNKDLNIKVSKSGLCANVIIDGKIMNDAVRNMGVSEKWIYRNLRVQGKKIENILLGTLDGSQKLLLYEKNVNESIEDVLE